MATEFDFSNPWLWAVGINTILFAIATVVPKKLLTPAGYLHAWVLGTIVWGTLGWRGYAIVLFYFAVGSVATKIGFARKEAAGIAEGRSGVRGPENVWGSALAGTLCALGTLLAPPSWQAILVLGYAASFSTKLSDTVSSEVGKAYGRTTYLITTLQPVPKGTEGAVSLEGTLAGIAASIAVAVLARAIGSIDDWGILWCAIAAFIGTTLESLIGATLQERWDWLTNEWVNIANTTIGASVAIALGWLWQQGLN